MKSISLNLTKCVSYPLTTYRMKYIIILLLTSGVFSQNVRYLDEVFDDVIKTEDVIYGNAPDLPFIFLFEWNTYEIDLTMDVYEPEGDIETNRPVIIFLYSGSFFAGSNNLDDMVALSISAAKRGYVVLAINYRLGLNILSSYSGERAVYRAVQDLSAVIRFAREFHEEYKINPNKIFVWGSSAGSIAGLHLAFCDNDERPESTYGNWQDPDLGCIDCEGNEYNHDSKPNALVSCWGAIGDLNWIDDDDQIPTILFHGTADIVVPFDIGFPFSINITLPLVYGSLPISNKLQEVNLEHELHPAEGEGHEYWGVLGGNWTDGPNEYFYQIQDNAYSFLYIQLDEQILGDLNNDALVNILDVIAMINFVLEGEYIDHGDLNGDNTVDILDVILIVNIILG